MKANRTLICTILLALPFCAMAEEWRTFSLESGIALRIQDATPNRTIPYAYVEQGLESIAAIGKQQVLASRRLGYLGSDRGILYSLIATSEKTGSSEVTVDGQVRAGEKAWTYQARAEKEHWQESVLVVIEALSRLPNESAMGRAVLTPGTLLEKAALSIASLTSIPVYVPASIQSLDADAMDGCTSAQSSRNSFSISLYGRVTGYGETVPLPCEPSGAALVAEIHGDSKPMPDLSGRAQAILLQNGARGWFVPMSCGGSCVPATLYWQTSQASYWIQMRFRSTIPAAIQLRELLDTANSAGVAQPRPAST